MKTEESPEKPGVFIVHVNEFKIANTFWLGQVFLYFLFLFKKVVDQNKGSLKDGSVASSVAPVGREKYCVFLICSQESTFVFKKRPGKVRKSIGQDVYEICYCYNFVVRRSNVEYWALPT